MTPQQLATKPRTIALVGNPNVGKSTLFNGLTGGRQRVANYPGVTIDVCLGEVAGETPLRLVDLPGAYSLRPAALDDAVVERVLTSHDAPDVVVVVLDAANLRRNLYLLSEVFDLGLPVVVALNMVDEARRAGLTVPTESLREVLGVPVIETVATEHSGIHELKAALDQAVVPTRGWRFEGEADEARLSETPGPIWSKLTTDPEQRAREVPARHAWISHVLSQGADQDGGEDRSERYDRLLLHPVAGPLAFLVIMGVVFQSIFSWASPLMESLEAVVGWVQAAAQGALPDLIGVTATSLVCEGVIAGVGAVVVFLPQILILFLFVSLLEDSGYMARAAFLVDRPLRAIGLSGRSFIPMLSSFACAIPGVMATRTIPSRRERLLAILVAPLMTCSARLPVYVLLIAAFVPDQTVLGFLGLQGLILFGLYLAGMAAGATLAFVASRRRTTRGRLLPLVVELPPYRRPTLQGILLKLKVRGGDFLKRAGTVIFTVSVVLWFLSAFPRLPQEPGRSEQEHAAAQISQSYAGQFGHAIEPVIRPLGYDWKIGVGLFASFAAREVFVGTMGVVYSLGSEEGEDSEGLRAAMHEARDPETGRKIFSLATVFSLLAFFVFALQCGATVAVVKREAGSWRFALGQLAAYLALAYVAAFVTYRVFAALGYA